MGSRHPSMPRPFLSPIPQKQQQEARGLGSKSQSGFPLVLHRVRHTVWTSWLTPADNQCRTRKPHRLDKSPSPNLSLLTHRMGS